MTKAMALIAVTLSVVGCSKSTPDDYNLLTVPEQITAEDLRSYAASQGSVSAQHAKTTVTVKDFETAIKEARTPPNIYNMEASVLYGEVAVGTGMNGYGMLRVHSMFDDPDNATADWVQVGHDGASELYHRCVLVQRCLGR